MNGYTVEPLLRKINAAILNPLITLLFAIALLYFLYGVFQFVRKTDDTKAMEEGKQAMLWGIIGMFIMFAVAGIIGVVLNTFGISTDYLPF
ncbi:MAG TPA: hypothetical protein VJC12_02145 [Candidatus Paceibacterota bacterium]